MSDIQLPGASAQITANTSGFRGAIGQAQSSLLSLEPIVARQWWGLQNLSRAFGAVGTAVAAGFGMAVREAMSWESAMVGIQRTTGASDTELAKIEKDLRKVANTTPIAVSELAGLAEQAGALGIENNAIPSFVQTLGNLIASTNLTEASVDDLARVLNILQVPQDDFDRFASTLLDVGRNTAATETEILSMAKRFAPVAAAAHLTASEVLGISAAVLSLGPRVEAGATGVNKTFYDMASAISAGGADLELFATTSGETSDQFAKDFQQKPAQTFAAFLTGLGGMGGGLIEMDKRLSDLGVTEVRQRQALIALAGGTQAAGDQQRNLNEILKLADTSWRDNTALVDVAKQRYGTTAAQLQILSNQIADAANVLGKALLPGIKLIVGVLQDFIYGFTQLPGPIQLVLGALVALIGAISLIAGGVLALVGPLVLMLQTFRALSSQFKKTAADAEIAAVGTSVVKQEIQKTGAVAVVASEQLALFDESLQITAAASTTGATQLALFGTEVGVAGSKAVVAGEKAAIGAGGFSKFTKAGIALTSILAAAGIVMTIFGHKAREASNEVEEAVKPNLQLVDAIDQQARGLNNAADEWLLQASVMDGVIDKATALHIEMRDLFAVIKGQATPDFAKGLVDQLRSAGEAGDQGAKDLLSWVQTTYGVYRESASASGHLKDARAALGIQNEDTANTEKDLADATEEARKAQDAANQGIVGYIDALMSEAQAAFAVKDAQDAYSQAVSESGNQAEATAKSENSLAQARNDHDKALRDLAQAEEDLTHVREKQAQDLADAEDALFNSQDSYLDSLDKVADAEDKLAKLREGPSAENIAKATDKLADAHRKLRDAEQKVEDSEWQLAYLRGEGASDRTVQDAEEDLQDARDDVKDATNDVADAEKDLDDARKPTDPKEIAAAERDVEGARRDSAAALREINTREHDLAELRQNIAQDTAYKDAQDAVTTAQGRVYDSLQKVRDAELELAKIRAGSLQDNVAKAQLDLERALYDQARAAVEVQKQQAAMRGEFWDTGREAQALADQLSLLVDQAPTEEARKRLLDYIDVLRQAKPLEAPPKKKDEQKPDAGPGGNSAVGGNDLSEVLGKPEDAHPPTEDEEWWEKLFSGDNAVMAAVLGPILIKGLIAAVTALAGATALITGLMAALPFIIAGVLIAGIVAALWKSGAGEKIIDGIWTGIQAAAGFLGNIGSWLMDHILSPLADAGRWLWDVGGDILHGLWDGLMAGLDWLTEWPREMWNAVVDTLKRVFGISSPSTVMAGIGGDIVMGMLNGLMGAIGAVFGFFAGLGTRIFESLGNAAGWLLSAGSNIMIGLFNGITTGAGRIFDWFNDLPSTIFGILERLWGGATALGGEMFAAGKNIVIGLWNGMVSMGTWLWDSVWGWVKDVLPGPVKWALGIDSPSKVMAELGKYAAMGIGVGVLSQTKYVENAAKKLATASIPDMSQWDDIVAQFNDGGFRNFATSNAEFGRGFTPPPAEQTPVTNTGDTFQITGADERDAVDIAEEVMFKKLVRTGG